MIDKKIVHPKEWIVRTYSTNKQAKAFIEALIVIFSLGIVMNFIRCERR